MRGVGLGVAALLTVALAAFAGPAAGGATGVRHAPPAFLIGHSASLNWSGYASYGTQFSDVKGSWTQPTANCTTNKSTYSSFWVGIDGYNSGTVEQLGTEADCSHGRPSYYAWWEIYPQPSNTIPGFTVTPGQTYTAEVKYNGNNSFTLTLSGGGNAPFTTTQALSNAARSSAEWITEAPSLCAGGCHLAPLTDFGTVNFSGASADGKAINAYSFDPLTMVTNGGHAKASPSPLGGNGTSFSVTFQR
jgi:hypothetical protein